MPISSGILTIISAKKFKSETGQTIADYQKNKKIELGKKLLRTTNKSIQEISNLLSFSSHSHFTATFKSMVGMMPSEYRAKEQRL